MHHVHVNSLNDGAVAALMNGRDKMNFMNFTSFFLHFSLHLFLHLPFAHNKKLLLLLLFTDGVVYRLREKINRLRAVCGR